MLGIVWEEKVKAKAEEGLALGIFGEGKTEAKAERRFVGTCWRKKIKMKPEKEFLRLNLKKIESRH